MTTRGWTCVELQPLGSDLPSEEWAACCMEALAPLGCLGTEEKGSGESLRVLAWLPEDADVARVDALLADAGLRASTHGAGRVEDPGWVEQFNASLKPVNVGRRITILPRPGEAPPGRIAIVIEPGRAFGTGHHESTRLALEHLESCVTPGCSVLDVGTGSGLLALAAVRLGAARAVGIDIDPEAIEVARENIETQPEASRVSLWTCSDPAQIEGRFDVVIANIQHDVLSRMLSGLADKLAPGGTLILSGLLAATDRDPMSRSLAALGMDVAWSAEGEWVSARASLARRA